MSNIGSLFFYFTIFIFSATLLRFSKTRLGQRRHVTFWLAVLIPVFIAMYRGDVGTDYSNYYIYYRENGPLSFSEYLLKDGSDGTTFGVWFFSRIGYLLNWPELYFALFALVILLPVAVTLQKHYTDDIYFLAMLGYLLSSFVSGFNGMKQTAAVAICLLSFEFIYRRKFLKFALVIGCAMLFHPTAIAGFAFYFFYDKDARLLSLKRMAVVGACVLGVVFSSEILMMMGERFEGYANASADLNNRIFYLNAAWVLVYFALHSRLTQLDRRNDFLVMMAFVGLIFGLTGFSSNAVKRITSYFNIAGFLLRAQIPLLFKGSDKTVMQFVMFAYIIALFVYSYYFLGFGDIFPYVFSFGE